MSFAGIDAVNLAKKSHGRCLLREDFIDIFYEKFLNSSPEIKPYFKNTDFVEQKKLLKHGLNCLIMYSAQNKAGDLCLNRIANSHSKMNLNIPPRFYALWKRSFLKTVEEIDPKLDIETLRAWDEVIEDGVDFITSRYDTEA